MLLKVPLVFDTFLNLQSGETIKKIDTIHRYNTFKALILFCCSGRSAPSSYFSVEWGGLSTGFASMFELPLSMSMSKRTCEYEIPSFIHFHLFAVAKERSICQIVVRSLVEWRNDVKLVPLSLVFFRCGSIGLEVDSAASEQRRHLMVTNMSEWTEVRLSTYST